MARLRELLAPYTRFRRHESAAAGLVRVRVYRFNLSVLREGCKNSGIGYNSWFLRGYRGMPERRKIVFGGRVQGVGFRMTAVQMARDLALSGTVRNCSDGRVELMAEGEPAEIDKLVGRLREHFGAFV